MMTKILRSIAVAAGPFVEGVARAIDMFGSLSSPMPYEEEGGPEADAKALHRDWETVGEDLRSGVDRPRPREDRPLVGAP